MNHVLLRILAVVLSGVSPEKMEKKSYRLKNCPPSARLFLMPVFCNSNKSQQRQSSLPI